MNKSLLSRALVAAAVVAVAGVAQAETFDSPYNQAGDASTMTHGQPNMSTNNIGPTESSALPAPVMGSSYSETTILGGPPSTMGESTVIYSSPVYVQPNSDWSMNQSRTEAMHSRFPGGATSTSPIPDRAGEASTIVNGVPNLKP
jgi:hypothetical protein